MTRRDELAYLARALDLAIVADRRDGSQLTRAEVERCAAEYDRARLAHDCQVAR